MEQHEFTIRRSFLLPLGLVVLLFLALLVTCLVLAEPIAKVLILGALLVPTCIIFAESSRRRVSIENDSIRVHKLLRSKQLSYNELTSIDTVLIRKRAFVSLSSEEDFLILSNSYADFGILLHQLLEKAPQQIISEETKQLAIKPPERSSDIFSAWLAVGVLLLIIVVQLRGAL